MPKGGNYYAVYGKFYPTRTSPTGLGNVAGGAISKADAKRCAKLYERCLARSGRTLVRVRRPPKIPPPSRITLPSISNLGHLVGLPAPATRATDRLFFAELPGPKGYPGKIIKRKLPPRPIIVQPVYPVPNPHAPHYIPASYRPAVQTLQPVANIPVVFRKPEHNVATRRHLPRPPLPPPPVGRIELGPLAPPSTIASPPPMPSHPLPPPPLPPKPPAPDRYGPQVPGAPVILLPPPSHFPEGIPKIPPLAYPLSRLPPSFLPPFSQLIEESRSAQAEAAKVQRRAEELRRSFHEPPPPPPPPSVARAELVAQFKQKLPEVYNPTPAKRIAFLQPHPKEPYSKKRPMSQPAMVMVPVTEPSTEFYRAVPPQGYSVPLPPRRVRARPPPARTLEEVEQDLAARRRKYLREAFLAEETGKGGRLRLRSYPPRQRFDRPPLRIKARPRGAQKRYKAKTVSIFY